MKQRLLFDVPVTALTKPPKDKAKVAAFKTSAKKKATDAERGCEFCPSNKVHGIRKIMGKIRGRDIAVFAQSPGPDENDEGKELIGVSGQLWWRELKRVGISRSDVDVQNAMRCFPADWVEGYHGPYLKMRNPSAKELHCCSLHTDNAMAELKARQIIVLGAVAAKQILKTRSTPKTKIFWSDQLGAKVYLLDHPSFFVRSGGKGTRFEAWRGLIKQIAKDRRILAGADASAVSDRYYSIKQQNYQAVTTLAEARAAQKILNRTARKKRRLAFDIENAPDGTITCCGISPKPGTSFVFITEPMPDVPKGEPVKVRQVLEEILANPWYDKVFHFGCTDVEKLEKSGLRVEGFTHDTYYSEYLRYSDLPSYALDVIAERRYPEFAGYHTVVAQEMLSGVGNVPERVSNGTDEEKYKYIQDKGLFDIRKLLLKTLVLYNGADCDITKRVEIDNKKHVPQALMKLYIDLGTLLHEMEANGPLFDFEQLQALDVVYPFKTKKLKKECRSLVRKKTRWYKNHETFNPASPDQVKQVLYSSKEGFGLDYPFADSRKKAKPNTEKITLLTLAREHPFPRKILDYRSVSKVKSTNESYRFCATANNGHLTTRWNGTGTRTGRLSSSGDKNKKAAKRINLQNVKKDPQIRNLCIADPRWKRVYEKIDRVLAKRAPKVLKYWHSCTSGEKAAKKAGKKWKAPEMDAVSMRQLNKAARIIEAWLRKYLPDFKTYVVADYGQVEIRVAAQLSGDKNLIEDCKSSDIHVKVGVTMTGWDADLIANDEPTRTLTKNVHFAVLFGIAEDGVFEYVNGRTEPEAREKILADYRRSNPDEDPVEVWRAAILKAYRRYFKRYRGIKKWIDKQRAFAEANSYVETIFGMIQTLNITSGYDEFKAEAGEGGGREAYWGNMAINGPVQGSAHQLMICALVNLIRKRKKYRMLGIPPMEVHDALYFVMDVLKIGRAVEKIKYLLEQESLNTVRKDFPDIDWTVPIVVDLKGGVRLGTMVKVKPETTPGMFLIDWFRICRKQVRELDKELMACAA